MALKVLPEAVDFTLQIGNLSETVQVSAQSAVVESESSTVGQLVHEILAPIGAGGMGEVYRARDTGLKLGFALKPGHALGIAGKELVIARNQRRRPIAPKHFFLFSGPRMMTFRPVPGIIRNIPRVKNEAATACGTDSRRTGHLLGLPLHPF